MCAERLLEEVFRRKHHQRQSHLSRDVLLSSFCPEGFVGFGVPIGTDAFVQNFVAKTCKAITDDVEELDDIQDGFIHYQFLRFCQTTRLQYINTHILLGNRSVLQQQHVDYKIADALLKKGTKQHADGWDTSSKAWVHMVLFLKYVRACGCPRMTSRTLPHGHHPPLSSFTTSMTVF